MKAVSWGFPVWGFDHGRRELGIGSFSLHLSVLQDSSIRFSAFALRFWEFLSRAGRDHVSNKNTGPIERELALEEDREATQKTLSS
jgi:hypothetical protein